MKRIGSKKIHSVKSHGMLTRQSKARTLKLNHDFGKENIAPEMKKASWNLKDEIAKVIKAKVALGSDVQGREKDIVEEIVRIIKLILLVSRKGFYRAIRINSNACKKGSGNGGNVLS
ncbi:hypothetical protein Ddye_016192 [Dipteronia dyeriana]|uniref:Uncharacterized protein n=1 Tax=Dipteronia dyeriana TaxID=168575 RepID=A0AAD9U6Y5_9ROSI|nr:hypothetical protein Ddye_016192 [Dipteronia dyeriana]